MMNTDDFTAQSGEGAVSVLSEADCWQLLDGTSFGRLAVSVGDQPEIFPVNYFADGRTVLFRTAEGTKLLELTINSLVAFETDHYSDTDAWSVVVKGARPGDREPVGGFRGRSTAACAVDPHAQVHLCECRTDGDQRTSVRAGSGTGTVLMWAAVGRRRH